MAMSNQFSNDARQEAAELRGDLVEPTPPVVLADAVGGQIWEPEFDRAVLAAPPERFRAPRAACATNAGRETALATW
jgi:hypothetical protein